MGKWKIFLPAFLPVLYMAQTRLVYKLLPVLLSSRSARFLGHTILSGLGTDRDCRLATISYFLFCNSPKLLLLSAWLSVLGTPSGDTELSFPIRGRLCVSEQRVPTEDGAPVYVCELITQT